MLRMFVSVLFTGTIVVQCTSQAPPSPDIGPKTATTKSLKTSTPTKTPMIKRGVKASPTSTKTPELSATATSERSNNQLPDCVQINCNCNDFVHQKEAQVVLDAFPDDPHGLDRNKDGVACESLPK